jgi:hypothetical protein
MSDDNDKSRVKVGTRRFSRQRRRITLDRALKQAAKAGLTVKGAEIYDDRLVLQFGEPATNGEINPWDMVLSDAANKKRSA